MVGRWHYPGARQKHPFHVWAYVIMPEHTHLLIWPNELEYDISEILNSIKQSVAKRALLYVRREAAAFLRMEDRQPNGEIHYRFWQRGGDDIATIIEPATAFEQIEYMHNYPVRRGLCEKPEDWHWSSAAEYAGLVPVPLTMNANRCP